MTMMAAGKPDMILKGIGGGAGGDFGRVHIEGIGRVNGPLTCDTFRLDGVGNIDGAMGCAESCELHGKIKVEGGLLAPRLILEGQARFNGRLRAGRMNMKGMVTIAGDCEAEEIRMEGGFTVGGLLNADVMEIRLQARGRVKEIGGDRIRITRGSGSQWSRLLGWLLPALDPHLSAGTIEGDDIELEETTADRVRGNRVVIGPGCRIGQVEYGSELTVHPSAEVGGRCRS